MQFTPILSKPLSRLSASSWQLLLLRMGFSGCLICLSFAPFHFPGLAILGMAMLFHELSYSSMSRAFLAGFTLGLSFFGLGVSWVFVSIHEYGGLNLAFASAVTLFFLAYLALFPAAFAAIYARLCKYLSPFASCLLFASLWVLSEYCRSTCFTGFPWLLLGTGQFDTPLRYLLPITGTFGLSFIVCLSAGILSIGLQKRRLLWVTSLIFIMLSPNLLKQHHWVSVDKKRPISVGVIQANLSMRDKWDDAYFWSLLDTYIKQAKELIAQQTNLIVMPESAIPVPPHYIEDTLSELDSIASQSASAVLLGMPTLANRSDYFNTLRTLGNASGYYAKQHLVPFGEYIPKPFRTLVNYLQIPDAHLQRGQPNQALIQAADYWVGSLICYELAYPEYIRLQLPRAAWIVSVSDDGWFGHSLAAYQQLQMAQALSLQTGRYQVVANNDGLSAIINELGEITASLPAFSAGKLTAKLYPASGITPWSKWGDFPTLIMTLLLATLPLLSLVVKRFRP